MARACTLTAMWHLRVWPSACVSACLSRRFSEPRRRDEKHDITGGTGAGGTDAITNNTDSSTGNSTGTGTVNSTGISTGSSRGTTSTGRTGDLPGLSPAGSAAAHQLIAGFATQQADDLRGVQLPSGTPLEALWDQACALPDLVSTDAPTSTSETTTTTTDTDTDDDDLPTLIDIDDSDDDDGDDNNDSDDDFGRINAVTANDFDNEYPMRELPSHEAQAARAATNTFISESDDRLRARLFTPTNVVDEVDVQPRPTYPDTGVRVAHPVQLFRPLITLTPKHGPLASLLCDGAEAVELTNEDFWQLLCLWVTLATKDCALASKWAAAGLKPKRSRALGVCTTYAHGGWQCSLGNLRRSSRRWPNTTSAGRC